MRKQHRYQLTSVVIYMVALCAANRVFAEDDIKAKAEVPQMKNAFGAFAASGLDGLAVYAKMPDKNAVVSSESFPRIVREFDWWLRYALKPECVPGTAFVKKHIFLVPAIHRGAKEDVAFLSYEVAGKTYMIVQTGGLDARMLIFVHDDARKEPRSTSDAAADAKNTVSDYLSTKVQSHIPAFSAKKVNTVYVGEAESSGVKKGLNRVRWFAADREICLSIQKINFEGTLPANEPLRSEWFSWGKAP